jgi:GNAT superfamily N-acetyltransferase
MSWRRAGPGDAEALRDLERAANVVGLAHVFGDTPFPEDDVLARWRATLVESGAVVLLHDHAFTSWDADGRVRHLAVHPDAWGRGLGREGLALAVAAVEAAGVEPHLWALELNHRALRLYDHLGWVRTGETRRAGWPPHPVELRLRLPGSSRAGLSGSDRGR